MPITPVNSSTRPLDRAVASPREPVRDLPRPLVSEPDIENDPASALTKPLLSDPARDNEPIRVLESVTCSTRLADSVSDPDSVLKIPECATWLEARVNELVNILKSE